MMEQKTQFTLVGWIIFLMFLYMLNRTRVGHSLIYWMLVLIAVYLFVGNYKRILPVVVKDAAASTTTTTTVTQKISSSVGGAGNAIKDTVTDSLERAWDAGKSIWDRVADTITDPFTK
jgi:hypothetical protein